MEINWITDVIVPLGASLIGGVLALVGALITIGREKAELRKERFEKAKPILINYSINTITKLEEMSIYTFRSDEEKSSASIIGVFKNTDNGIVFFDYIETETKVYKPINNVTVDKNTIFCLKLENINGENFKKCNVFCHDIFRTQYCYQANFKVNSSIGRMAIVIGSIYRVCEKKNKIEFLPCD